MVTPHPQCTQSSSNGITHTHRIFGLLLAPSVIQPVTYHEPSTLTTDIYHHLSTKYDDVQHEHCDMTSSHMDIVTFEEMTIYLTLKNSTPISAYTRTLVSFMPLMN